MPLLNAHAFQGQEGGRASTSGRPSRSSRNAATPAPAEGRRRGRVTMVAPEDVQEPAAEDVPPTTGRKRRYEALKLKCDGLPDVFFGVVSTIPAYEPYLP